MKDQRHSRIVHVGPAGRGETRVIGLRAAIFSDLYYVLQNRSWAYLLGFISSGYLLINAFFGFAYSLTGDCLANVAPGSFRDAFFFSVQTLATIGYGYIYPKCLTTNVLVTCESLVGLTGFAVVTGIAFNKFSRPRARVMFSKVAVVAQHDGLPTLMFRMANERSNYIADATLHVSLVWPSRTKEGRVFTRMRDLELVRHRSSMFTLTWTALHQINDKSPLYELGDDGLAEGQGFLVCSLTGYDATIGQTIHARHTYPADSVIWRSRFADVLHRPKDGPTVIDYTKFHDFEKDDSHRVS